MSWPLLRGQIVQVAIGLEEPKLAVVVSNNRRNALLDTVLVVRLTSSSKPAIPSIVELGSQEAFHGRAVCDDVFEIYENEVLAVRGGATGPTMAAIDDGLRAALGLH